MDSDQCVDILKGGVMPSFEKLGIPERERMFQQDNDPKHTSKKAINYFNTQDYGILDWPTQSPDLNPIEHLWTTLKNKLNNYDSPPLGVWELWDRAAEKWGEITEEDCQKLIRSMPRRLQAVVKAKGGHTKY